jgi:hypothetical protein
MSFVHEASFHNIWMGLGSRCDMFHDIFVCLRNPATILPSSALPLVGTAAGGETCCVAEGFDDAIHRVNRTKYAHRQLFFKMVFGIRIHKRSDPQSLQPLVCWATPVN